MDEFCLLVAIPCLRAPAKYDRFSVWCLNPGGAETPAYGRLLQISNALKIYLFLLK